MSKSIILMRGISEASQRSGFVSPGSTEQVHGARFLRFTGRANEHLRGGAVIQNGEPQAVTFGRVLLNEGAIEHVTGGDRDEANRSATELEGPKLPLQAYRPVFVLNARHGLADALAVNVLHENLVASLAQTRSRRKTLGQTDR